ncbi:hypothetical protein BDV28DRAFT_160629 [Aspergillus coremiiformis]|uniref:deuterolysin n=1 Tax=Aspergillus coremiiformis TaxID=138285 RepID=A0A5N6YUX2_9EURO|nr:hypothetical protein BDV28DRAFT_160629 [Aspergillus coremiiformis]
MRLNSILLTLTLSTLATAAVLNERATYKNCDGSEGEKVKAAVVKAGKMAAKAASSIRSKQATSLFKTFFKTTDSASTSQVADVMEQIAQEASQYGRGKVSYSCQPDSISCQSGGMFSQTGYATTDGVTGEVHTCPAYFDLPPASHECSALDQQTSSLHELAHTKGVLGFEVYGYSSIMGLDSSTALKNAESYAFFAKCEFFFYLFGVERRS